MPDLEDELDDLLDGFEAVSPETVLDEADRAAETLRSQIDGETDHGRDDAQRAADESEDEDDGLGAEADALIERMENGDTTPSAAQTGAAEPLDAAEATTADQRHIHVDAEDDRREATPAHAPTIDDLDERLAALRDDALDGQPEAARPPEEDAAPVAEAPADAPAAQAELPTPAEQREQAEQTTSDAAAAPDETPVPTSPAPRTSGAAPTRAPVGVRIAHGADRGLRLLSLPMRWVPVGLRDTVGWFGLVTIFTALCLWVAIVVLRG